jgi:hypothetical protein
MIVFWVLNALALAFGAFLGARGLVDPKWAARLVRLKEDEQGGGFAEFRATYGGVFLGLHAVALFFTLQWIAGREAVIGTMAAGAAAALCAGWAGAAFGRLVSMWRDQGTRTAFNRVSVAVESALAVLIGGPWAAWFLGVTS